MEKQKEKRPQAPLFINCHDIQLIEGGELHTARRRLTQIKKSLGLGRNDKLSIWAYCKANNLTIDQVIPYYLRVLLIAATIAIGFAFSKMVYNYLYDMYKKNKVIKWEIVTPTHMEGRMYDTAGNKIKVEINWIGPPPTNTKPRQ